MKLADLLAAKAAVSLLFGLAFVVAPKECMSLMAVDLDPNGALLARMVGACLAGIGLVCWLSRQAEAKSRAGVALALCLADALGFVIVLVGQLGGLMNGLGWIIVVLWGVFALGLGYFRFLKPESDG